jgi:hypothetical protein
MKKAEVAKDLDPDQVKILDWKEGKERNIRYEVFSLLFFVHSIMNVRLPIPVPVLNLPILIEPEHLTIFN